jgi:hypothetical protein
MATEAHGDDAELSTNAKLAHSQSATYRCAVVEEWRVNIDTVFEIVYIHNATAEPEAVWNAQDAVDCNCSNLTLYLSAALRCEMQGPSNNNSVFWFKQWSLTLQTFRFFRRPR